jgi:hypothetical protein
MYTPEQAKQLLALLNASGVSAQQVGGDASSLKLCSIIPSFTSQHLALLTASGVSTDSSE